MMEFQSCFDIIGPIMVGPSSSHTAGAVSIGRFVYEFLNGCPNEAEIIFYDSFAETYQGHGTDKALLGGLLGLDSDDSKIKDAAELSKQQKLHYKFLLEETCPYFDHPNTTIITAKRESKAVKVGGVSLGGGLSKIFLIDNYKVDILLNTSTDLRILVADCKRKP